MAGGAASVATSETEVRKERQLDGVTRVKVEEKRRIGRLGSS
jgi:hypothetical protein